MRGRRGEKWAKYEELGHKIVSELLPFASVTLDDHIRGGETETERQIDVSVRWTVDDAEYLMILQIRDRQKRADVNTVGEFKSVIQDVGANKGVLICSGGFSKQAITYARNIGINIYSLHDAQSKHWSRELTVPLVWIELRPDLEANCEFYLEGGDTVYEHPKQSYFVLTPDDGKNMFDIVGTFEKKWNAGELDRTVGVVHRVKPEGEFRAYVVDSFGKQQWRPVREFALTYTVSRESWLGWYSPNDFRGLTDFLAEEVFIPSYMNLDDLPFQRDPNWPRVSDPAKVVVRTNGAVVTTVGFQLQVGSGKIQASKMRYLGPK